MKVSTFLHDYEGGLLGKFIIPSIESKHEVIKQNKCICELVAIPTREELGDLVVIHPDSDNISGCYDAISKFVEQFPEIPFYILALQDSANRESRVEGIGPHKNVNYITDENRRELISYLMGI